MDFLDQHIYHFYNRTINNDLAFHEHRNYIYFLEKYRKYLHPHVATLAYCLMPTHFHFLIRIQSSDIDRLKKNIGIILSSYAKAINKAYNRHGSLFEQHSKALYVDDESYLVTLMNYIHQNPLRQHLVSQLEDWPYSSYRDFAGLRHGTLVSRDLYDEYFIDAADFAAHSNALIDKIVAKYWV